MKTDRGVAPIKRGVSPIKTVTSTATAAAKDLASQTIRRLPPGAQQRAQRTVQRYRYRKDLVPIEELQVSFREALHWLAFESGGQPIGDYLEFGVCRGASMLAMDGALNQLSMADVRLFGFDSFEGLPQEAADQDDGVWQPGWFDADLKLTIDRLSRAGVDWRRTFLIQKWFSDLTPEVRGAHDMTKAGVIMVDCDIYSSTLEALDWCEPLIGRRCVVVFDDWNSFDLANKGLGEAKAFQEFLEKYTDIEVLRERDGYNPESKIFYLGRDPLL